MLGRPTLVADSTGLRELAQRGLVRAVPLAATPAETAAAVSSQLRRPFVPLTARLPTWDDCAAQLHALYQSVLAETA